MGISFKFVFLLGDPRKNIRYVGLFSFTKAYISQFQLDSLKISHRPQIMIKIKRANEQKVKVNSNFLILDNGYTRRYGETSESSETFHCRFIINTTIPINQTNYRTNVHEIWTDKRKRT